jgi:hypothetical protein
MGCIGAYAHGQGGRGQPILGRGRGLKRLAEHGCQENESKD